VRSYIELVKVGFILQHIEKHSKELHNLVSSTNISEKPNRMKWDGHAACVKNLRNTYKNWVGMEWNRSPGRPRHRPEDNIKKDLKRNTACM
jgi:hypothetical protein